MSKSTRKYRPVVFHFKGGLTANPTPSQAALEYQRFLNKCAQKVFKGTLYHSLTEEQRTVLHIVLKGGEPTTSLETAAQQILHKEGVL